MKEQLLQTSFALQTPDWQLRYEPQNYFAIASLLTKYADTSIPISLKGFRYCRYFGFESKAMNRLGTDFADNIESMFDSISTRLLLETQKTVQMRENQFIQSRVSYLLQNILPGDKNAAQRLTEKVNLVYAHQNRFFQIIKNHAKKMQEYQFHLEELFAQNTVDELVKTYARLENLSQKALKLTILQRESSQNFINVTVQKNT